MGIILSLCKEATPTKVDLIQTVQQQDSAIKSLHSQVTARMEDIDILKNKLAIFESKLDKSENVINKTLSLVDLHYRKQTADEILKSKINLAFLDDTVEHEYICNILSWLDNEVFKRGISFEKKKETPPLLKTNTRIELDKIVALLGDSN